MNGLTHDPLVLAYHELRTPLGLVATMAHALAEDSTDAEVHARCEVIVRTVGRLLRTTQQIFSIAHAQGADLTAWYAPAPMAAQISEDLRGCGANIEVCASPAAAAAWSFGLATAWEALVQSLLMNAIDHGRPGMPIVMDLSKDNGKLVLEVSNQVMPGRAHDGLGTGLYLCRQLAERLGSLLTTTGDETKFHAEVQLSVYCMDVASERLPVAGCPQSQTSMQG